MSFKKYDGMWGLINKYDLFFSDLSESEKLICGICKRVMVNAVKNNSCGCHYCYECVHEYTNGEEKYCPGEKKECKEELIMLGEYAVKSPELNNRISRLNTKCPNDSCPVYVELIEMEKHLGSCIEDPMREPSDKNDTETNAVGDTEFENMKNEILGLRENLSKSNSDIANLKTELADKERRMMRLEMESEAYKQYVNQVIGNLKLSNLEERKSETLFLGEQLSQKEIRIVGLEDDMNELKNKVTKAVNEQKECLEDVRKMAENTTTIMASVMDNTNTIIMHRENDIRLNNQWIKWNRLCPKIEADFLWRIEGLSTKKGTSIWSDSFTYNNYKLCLFMTIAIDDNISLRCYIMKGDCDDELVWPMKRDVTLSIIDQDSLKSHTSETYQTSYTRPSRDRIVNVGSNAFIKYSLVKNNSSIITNDSIVISCIFSEQ